MLSDKKLQVICILGGIALATLTVYAQVRDYQFISFDDGSYVYDNPYVKSGLTLNGFLWILKNPVANNWHPLTMLTHMIDCQLYGLAAGKHHLTNAAIHIVNAVLMFIVFNLMTKRQWESAFIAALFALHPMHVESVAWVSERKDVLSTFFGLLAIIFYVEYTERVTEKTRLTVARLVTVASNVERLKRNRQTMDETSFATPTVKRFLATRYFLLATFFYLLSLLSKPMLVTLPFVLLLLDYWPLRRPEGSAKPWRSRIGYGGQALRLIIEKVPFLILAVITSIITFAVQKDVGLVKSLESYPLLARMENAVLAYGFYITKMFWPVDLAIFYPHTAGSPDLYKVLIYSAIIITVTIYVLIQSRRRPYLVVGWLWFLGTLVPVIGIVQVGLQAYADRYTYLPYTGLFIMIGWGVPELLGSIGPRYKKTVLIPVTSLLLIAAASVSYIQAGYWRDNITLYKHATESANSWWANHFLGRAYASQNRFSDAAACFKEALQIDPKNAAVKSDLAYALFRQGDLDNAEQLYYELLPPLPDISYDPNTLGTPLAGRNDLSEVVRVYTESHNNLATILIKKGNIPKAIRHLNEILRVSGDISLQRDSANSLFQQAKYSEAFLLYQNILRFFPDDAEANNMLGVILGQQGQLDKAAVHFNKAIKVRPSWADPLCNLGNALMNKGDIDGAINCFNKALTLDPSLVNVHYLLGRAMIQKNRPDEAISHLRQTLRLAPDWPAANNDLAGLVLKDPNSTYYNPQEALQFAQKACSLTGYNEPDFLDTLSLAYTAAGKNAEALELAGKAEAKGYKELAEKIRKRTPSR